MQQRCPCESPTPQGRMPNLKEKRRVKEARPVLLDTGRARDWRNVLICLSLTVWLRRLLRSSRALTWARNDQRRRLAST
jgi:hypothetical protein